MTYRDPHQYWTDRGYTYPNEVHDRDYQDFPGKQDVITILTELKPHSLLEAGCGSGRLFPLYKNVERVVGADFSISMLSHAKKVVDSQKLNIELKHIDLKYAHTLREVFDIVITRNVLMHVKYDNITEVVESIKKLCGKHALLIEYDGTAENLSVHCFSHNYPALFHDFKIRKQKEVDGNTVFLFERVNK